LAVSGVLEAPGRRDKLPEEWQHQNLARDSSFALRAAIRARWPSPGDLFARIGHPKPLQITAHFLIGWRVSIMPEQNSWYFCRDPQLVAGVQARCSGDLYLSLRDPDLRWERLLSPSMNNLFNRPSASDAAAIRERIFNVLPAASYQMEKLFGLFDIEFSTETETAAVECRTTPRLLLNKGFLDKYCQDDGDLFLLIFARGLSRHPGTYPALSPSRPDRQHRL
jgi:hypothetical protein